MISIFVDEIGHVSLRKYLESFQAHGISSLHMRAVGLVHKYFSFHTAAPIISNLTLSRAS